jgi:serine/threonine protein kinase/ABC-type branched-subunit amino acid transport system substrate-binding protein/uncharacterized caspase-like protein
MHRNIELGPPPRHRPGVRPGRSVVAVIGIDQYVAWPVLSNAVSDATGVARLFRRLGFVEVTSPLLDGAATGEAMRRLLTDDLAQLAPDDSLVLFFAGHGHTHTANFSDVSVKTGYVIPVDAAGHSEHVAANWLRLDSWLSDVARLPPRHILVIIDACHSGVALGALIKWRGAGSSPTSELDELQERRSRRIITSALDDQRAMDSGPYPGHSLFTGCLIEGLSGGLSESGRRLATGSELGLYVQRRVSSYPMSRQTPDFGALELDDRGEIVVPLLSANEPPNAPAPPSEPLSSTGASAEAALRVPLPLPLAEPSSPSAPAGRRVDIPKVPAPHGMAMSLPTAAAQHELLVELGRGGMGVVHLARCADGRLIVVKRLRPELARNVNVRRSFLEEARIAARIKHSSVVEVFGTGFDAKGVPWLEMEWAPGVSLQALTDAAPLPWDLYVAVIAELLAGLHAAHTVVGEDGETLALVHRDVSPHNVLVTYEGHAKILDFGIAKVRDSTLQTTTGVVKGKVTYLAPEQAARGPVDARTDLFSVGVMLWQQLAGRRLWEDVSEPEIFHRLISREIPDLREVAPQIEGPIVRVVQRALEPDPDARFRTAAELRSALLDASPLRASATADLARHVKECFADQLLEIEQLVRDGGGRRNASAHKATDVTTSLFRSGITSTKGAKRPVWHFVLISVGLAAAVIGITMFRAQPIAPVPVAACTSDDACGAGRHCGEDGACVSLAHDGCTAYLPDAAPASHPIYVGAMFPLTGPNADDYGRSNANAAKLAVREVNRLAGGIPAGAGRRPLGLILCDDAEDADGRARYLSTHVPAVVGFRSSGEALSLSRDVFLPRGVLVVSALNQSPLLAQMSAGHPRLFYRTAPNATEFAAPMARAVETMLAPEARRRAVLRPKDKVRVAVVRSGDATGAAYAEQVLRALGSTRGLEAWEIAVGDPGAAGNATLAAAIDKLAATPPHVILTLSDGLFPALIAPLEQRLHDAERKRPLYIGATTWEDGAFRAFIATSPERRARFFAISWPTSSRALRGFVERYNESFSEAITPVTASSAPYDSVYLLAYAAASAAAAAYARIDGAALSQAIARLGPNAPVLMVGPTTVVKGLTRVGGGERVDLQGVVSRFDFDDTTGDSPFDAVVLCTTYDPKTKLVDAADVPVAAGPFACP